ncbi:MAG: hypothetical protein JXR64_07710 [Spirochaetales bacterium]|nr:hypothetical protein [Spirochaetales bacterium]
MKSMEKLLLALALFCVTTLTFADDFFSDLGDESGSGVVSNLEFNGVVSLSSEISITEDSVNDTFSINEGAEALFNLGYTGDSADLKVTLNGDRDSINIDECYANLYFDMLNMEVGYFKTVWGKGDKLHVLDLLNPIDYSNYFTQDYLENKIAQPTIKVNVPVGSFGMLELAYVPIFEGDLIPTDGKWMPLEVKAAKTLLQGFSILYPDTQTLSYGQFGTRFTTSINGFDFGGLYYFGYDRQPTLNLTKLKMDYNFMNVAGIEFGTVLAGFNLRGELAYYFINNSKDTLNYLGGFDRDLPLHNVNINIQVKGEYNTESEDITNMVVGKISDSFNHEKITPSVTGMYNVEDMDFMIKPELLYKIGENIEIATSAGIFAGDDDTTFGQFDLNDYLSLTLKYTF